MSLQSDIFDKQGLGHWFSIGIILYPKDFLEKLWAIFIVRCGRNLEAAPKMY